MENTKLISEQTKILMQHHERNWIDIESDPDSPGRRSIDHDLGNISVREERIEVPRSLRLYHNNKSTLNRKQRSKVWKSIVKTRQSQIKFALTQSKVWANLASNIKPPTIVEKKMADMTENEQCCFVVDALNRK